MKMVFFKMTGIDQIVALHFPMKGMLQTLLVFFVIYLFIMLMNYLFIKRQSVLSLFQVRSNTESTGKGLAVSQVFIGIVGIIIYPAYYLLMITAERASYFF